MHLCNRNYITKILLGLAKWTWKDQILRDRIKNSTKLLLHRDAVKTQLTRSEQNSAINKVRSAKYLAKPLNDSSVGFSINTNH